MGETDQLIFPVNAKTPDVEDKKVASEFRKLVHTSCPYGQDDIPIAWFVLEQLIHLHAAGKGVAGKGVSIVSTKDCRLIAQRLKMDDDSFYAALKYLVALNIFHFYPTILPNVVFCHTQVLLSKISELVEHSHMLRGSSGATGSVCGGWVRFRDEGIITVEFLQDFKEHYVAGVFTPNDLLKILNALLITADFGEGEYFMPSLLYELKPENLDDYRCGIASFPPPLLVCYSGTSWLPSGIFTSLISYLQNVSHWKIVRKSGKPDCLHRNCIKFRLQDGQHGSVTLIDSLTHFEVHLASHKPVSLMVCSKIHKAIFNGLKQAENALSYTNLHPKEAIFCSGERCKPTPHPAGVSADRKSWTCLTDDDVGGELTEDQTVWFSFAEDTAQVKEGTNASFSTCSI